MPCFVFLRITGTLTAGSLEVPFVTLNKGIDLGPERARSRQVILFATYVAAITL